MATTSRLLSIRVQLLIGKENSMRQSVCSSCRKYESLSHRKKPVQRDTPAMDDALEVHAYKRK